VKLISLIEQHSYTLLCRHPHVMLAMVAHIKIGAKVPLKQHVAALRTIGPQVIRDFFTPH
jgi:hypothetical protein